MPNSEKSEIGLSGEREPHGPDRPDLLGKNRCVRQSGYCHAMHRPNRARAMERARNPTFSVIMPTFNEERSIAACINYIRLVDPGVEIIVVDGGSTDNTAYLARQFGVPVIVTPKGRGLQCNRGAACASGTVLVFLHADTRLHDSAFTFLESFFQRDDAKVGTFRLSFDTNHWLLKSYAQPTEDCSCPHLRP